MNAFVYVNGKITNARDATVPVFDHGFLLGEGIYETLRTYAGVPFLFDAHMRRLRRSADLIALPVPFSDAELLQRVHETMSAAAPPPAQDREEKYIRILLTRGVGALSYKIEASATPTLVIIVKPLELPPDRSFTDGLNVSLVAVRRNHPRALNPMIKSNNLLNLALAMQEAYRRGAEEALMQNQDGELVECSQSNFFLVRHGGIVTPPLDAGLLPGITREFVLALARDLHVPALEARLTPADLDHADEAFLTGTTREVTPIVAVDGRPIGRGVPGPITQRLLTHFRQRAAESGHAR